MLIIYSEFKKINSKYKYCTYSKEVIPLYVQKFVGELRLCFSKETKIIISLKLNYIITARICRKKNRKEAKKEQRKCKKQHSYIKHDSLQMEAGSER